MSTALVDRLMAMGAVEYVEYVNQTVRETSRRDPDWVVLTDAVLAEKTLIALKAISNDLTAQFTERKERAEDLDEEGLETYRAWKLRAYGFQRHLRWLQAQTQIACLPRRHMVDAVYAHRRAAEATGVEPEMHDLALWATLETAYTRMAEAREDVA